MMKKTRICWYCEKWQPGGIQVIQVGLLKQMNLDGLDVEILVSDDETSLLDEELSKLNIKKKVTLEKKYKNPARRVFANIFAFRKAIKHGNYDVVHLNVCHGVELIYCFWAWLYNVPIRIVHCRNNDIGAGGRSRNIKILFHHICKRLFAKCATIKLANSDLAAEWLFSKKDIKDDRVEIVKNGIDVKKYSYDTKTRTKLRDELGVSNNYVVGHVGHFNYQKNHEYLLRIFKELLEKAPDAMLLLVGAGENKQNIEKLAKQYGIEKNVIFYGVTNDIPSIMMAMDVFVFPSRFEGFGNVLIEAQATGLPCVASKSVIPEFVNLSPNFTWVDLSLSPKIWSEYVFNYRNHVRTDGTAYITKAGHDIALMAKIIEEKYREGEKA